MRKKHGLAGQLFEKFILDAKLDVSYLKWEDF
jgi:hypothetical protein